MSESLKKGDKVTWETSQGKTEGRVVKKQTSDTQIKPHRKSNQRRSSESTKPSPIRLAAKSAAISSCVALSMRTPTLWRSRK